MFSNPLKAYQTVESATLDGRALEASLLIKSAARMAAVQQNWDAPGREELLDESLRYNLRLWTVFQAEMANAENPIPAEIKRNLLSLSAFIDKRTFDTISYPDPAKLDILIAINRNIAAGLQPVSPVAVPLSSMASDPFSVSGSVFDVLGQDQSGQRSQLAQYALQRAAQQMQGNKLKEAITTFRQALAFDPQNTTALTYIGNINLSMGNVDEAVKAFKDLIKVDPFSSDAQIKLGNAYLQGKRYNEAEATFKTAARMDPRNPLPEYTLGIQYAQTDRLQEAEAQFRKVQRMVPTDGNVYYALGALHNKQGRYEESVQELKTALSLKPKFYEANFELGVAYTRLGQDDNASRQLDILRNARSALTTDLAFEINRPKILFVDGSASGFNLSLGPGTKVWMLDPANLTAPGASKTFSVKIQFNTQMDSASIAQLNNWTISRARSTSGGYYNNSVNGFTNSTEVQIASRPLSVAYDRTTMQATVSFTVAQNSTGDATIDPKHLVFKFAGQDAYGRSMNTAADEIDGYSPVKGF